MASEDLFSFLDIATEVSQNYGATDDVTIAKAKKWVNRALVRISEVGHWSWRETFDTSVATVSGTETYVLAANVKHITALWIQDTARRKLRLIDNRRFRQIYTQATTPQGTPLYYRTYGRDATTGYRKIALYPVPNAVFTVKYDYQKEMDLLVNNTDDVRVVTGMPDHMVDALIELATAISYREQDDSDYQSAMAESMARWRALYDEDNTEIDDVIRAASDDGGGGGYEDPILPPSYS